MRGCRRGSSFHTLRREDTFDDMAGVLGEARGASDHVDFLLAVDTDPEELAGGGGTGDELGSIAGGTDDDGSFQHGPRGVPRDEAEGVALGAGGALSFGAHLPSYFPPR